MGNPTNAFMLTQEQKSHTPERIVAAAIAMEFTDSTGYEPVERMFIALVPPPGRHHTVFAGVRGTCDETAKTRGFCCGAQQGFVTSTGRFVDRKEAYKIAHAACQIIKHSSSVPGTLYSEDLW